VAPFGFLNEQSQFVLHEGSSGDFRRAKPILTAAPPDSQYHGRQEEQKEAAGIAVLSALFGGYYRIWAPVNRAQVFWKRVITSSWWRMPINCAKPPCGYLSKYPAPINTPYPRVLKRFRNSFILDARPLIVAIATAGETACPTLLDQSFAK
jgi:hypothetical protein